jgi:uncharacterized protein YfaS (alpha-2-macroglobulin family)
MTHNVVDGTVTYAWKVPEDIASGEYTIQVKHILYLQTTTKIIRIRDYPRDLILVKTDLTFESYRPGDTVSGIIKAELKDGRPFEDKVSF